MNVMMPTITRLRVTAEAGIIPWETVLTAGIRSASASSAIWSDSGRTERHDVVVAREPRLRVTAGVGKTPWEIELTAGIR